MTQTLTHEIYLDQIDGLVKMKWSQALLLQDQKQSLTL